MFRKQLVSVLLLLFSAVQSFSSTDDDKARISGYVMEEIPRGKGETFRSVMTGCALQLFFEKNGKLDSLYTTSSTNGMFVFPEIEPQRVVVRASCMGFEKHSDVYELGPGSNILYIIMKRKSEELEAAKVTAEIPLMKQLKDTTIFNTQAIRSLEGESLTETLSQIPGFSVSDGKITIDGIPVSRTYINGRLLLGDDPFKAADKLLASEVTQVKVYDEQSVEDRKRGNRQSRKERVMNVITKDDFSQMSLANIAAAGGLDCTPKGRYAATGYVGFDSEMMNISLDAFAQNYPAIQSNIVSSERTSLVSSGALSDDKSQEHLALELQKYWKDRMFGNSMHFSYGFNHNKSSIFSRSVTDYFATAENPEYSIADSLSRMSSVYEHNMSMRLNLKANPVNTFDLLLSGNLSHGKNESHNVSLKSFAGVPASGSNERSNDKFVKGGISGNFRWSSNESLKWHPELVLEAEYSRNNDSSWTRDTVETSFLKRMLSSSNVGNAVKASASFYLSRTMVNNDFKTLNLAVGIDCAYDYSKCKKMSVDEWDRPEPVMYIANSYDFTRNELSSSAQINMAYNDSRKNSLFGSIAVVHRFLLNNERIPANFSKSANFIFPELNLNYRRPGLYLSFIATPLTPSIEQISNRIVDTNPLVLTGGNPDLKAAYSFTPTFSYSFPAKQYPKGSTSSFEISLKGATTLNPVVTRTYVFAENTVLEAWDGYEAKAGSMLNTFANAELPAWNVNVSSTGRFTFGANKIGTRFTVSGFCAQSSQFLRDNSMRMTDLNGTAELGFWYRPNSKLKINEIPTFSWLDSRGSNSDILSGRFVFRNEFSASWVPIKQLAFKLSYNFQMYKYMYGMGTDYNRHLLNFHIYTYLLKDRSLRMSFSAMDLLNSGSTYKSSVTSLYMNQSWKPVFGRYFIFSISWQFRRKK